MHSKILFVVALLIIAKANEASSKTLEGKDIEEPEVPGKESDEPKVPAVLGTDQYTWSWWWDMWIKLSLKICKTTCPLLQGRSCQQINNGLWCCLKVDCGTPSQTGYRFEEPHPDTKYCATVNVWCADGYETTPEKTSLKCQADGTWETARGCSKKNCGTPSKIGYEFGVPVPDTLFGSEVPVSCAECYEGPPDETSLSCQANGHWESASGCNKIDCDAPPAKEGYEIDDPMDSTCGSTVSVQCADGYVNGPDNSLLTCQDTGLWEIPTGCERIDCGTPSKTGYEFDDPVPDSLFGSEVSVSCAECYEGPPDETSLSCQANGHWESASGCNKIDCDAPPAKEGYEIDDPMDSTCGSTVSVQCADGYVNGPDNSLLTCQDTGLWEIPTGCERIDCGTPSKTGYEFDDPVPDSLFGSEVSVSCAECYEGPPDETSLSCQANGHWESASGCNKIDCDAPPAKEGYEIDDPMDSTCGSTVSVQCADGYVNGPDNSLLTCQDTGLWEIPTGCERIDCGTPSKTGYEFDDPVPDSLFGSEVSVSCAECYEGPPDETSLSCQANGHWESASGCNKIDCDAPPAKEGYEIDDPMDSTCGSTVSVQCADGYVNGPDNSLLTCQDTGLWEIPTGCERIDCGTPSKTGYEFDDPVPDSLFGSEVSVSCAECYEGPPDETSLSCQANGHWESASGCNKIDCDAPPAKEGYEIDDPMDSTCGSKVSVQCADGYVDGPDNSLLTCQDTGLWEIPTGCERIDCGRPSHQEGYDFGAAVPDTRLGSEVSVKCAVGYETSPSRDKLVCLPTGSWETVSGCNRIACPGTLKDVQCESWGFRYAECPVNEADVILNAVVAKKDSVSQCAYQGAGTAPANYPENMATLGLLAHMNNVLWVHSGCRAKVSVCHTDCGPWHLAYEHNHLGSAVSGSKADLIDKVRNGANVRVMLIRSNSDNPYVTSVQNAYVVGNELCGQALFHVSKANYKQFQDNAYWWFVNVCTTGHWQMSRWNVGEHHFRSNNTLKFALKWFVREEGQTPLVTLDSTGAVVAGSKSNVVDAIKQGHHVRVSSSLSPPGYNYSFPCDTLEHTADDSLGVCTALWHVSQKTVTRDGHSIKDFQLNAYWWFSLKTTNNDHKMSRWYVGDHSQPSSGNSEANKATQWSSDPCWQPVYKHNASGHLMNGSLSSLISHVKDGYRVKVQLQNVTLEADEIRIHNGHVCVSLLNDVSKSTIDTFNPTLSWVWRQCCTTGRCETMKYRVGENVETDDNSFDNETLTWFMDTPRQWTRVLTVAANESVTFGSKAALTDAIRAGSEVRYNLIDVFEDDPDFLIGHQADNLAIEGVDVGATHIRAISVSRPATETEIRFQPNPYWWFTITTTRGRLDRSRWTVGVHQDRGHDYRQIGVDWFVNEAT